MKEYDIYIWGSAETGFVVFCFGVVLVHDEAMKWIWWEVGNKISENFWLLLWPFFRDDGHYFLKETPTRIYLVYMMGVRAYDVYLRSICADT